MTYNLNFDIGSARMTQRGVYFQPNFDGDVKIKSVKLENTDTAGLMLFVECEIQNSNHPNHAAGQVCTWSQKMAGKAGRAAPGNIRQWITASMGLDPNNEAAAASMAPYCNQLFSEALSGAPTAQLLGRTVHLITRQILTKEEKKAFTIHDWSPATGKAGPPAAPVPQAQPAAAPPWAAQGAPQPQPAAAPPWAPKP